MGPRTNVITSIDDILAQDLRLSEASGIGARARVSCRVSEARMDSTNLIAYGAGDGSYANGKLGWHAAVYEPTTEHRTALKECTGP